MLLGSLQYRFASKEALLVCLMERAVTRATDAVRAAIEPTRDPLERLRLGMLAHLEVLLSGDDAVYVLLYDWRVLRGNARDSVVRLRDRYEALWDGILYEAAGAGRLRPDLDVGLLRLVGFGAINWVATWYRPEGRMTPAQIGDAIFRTIALGIVPEDARGLMDPQPASIDGPAAAPRRRPKRR